MLQPISLTGPLSLWNHNLPHKIKVYMHRSHQAIMISGLAKTLSLGPFQITGTLDLALGPMQFKKMHFCASDAD